MPPFSIQPLPIGPTFESIVSSEVLWSVFIGTLIIFLIFTWVLVYHWRKFDLSHSLFTVQAKITYFVGSIIIIIAIAASLIKYLNG